MNISESAKGEYKETTQRIFFVDNVWEQPSNPLAQAYRQAAGRDPEKGLSQTLKFDKRLNGKERATWGRMTAVRKQRILKRALRCTSVRKFYIALREKLPKAEIQKQKFAKNRTVGAVSHKNSLKQQLRNSNENKKSDRFSIKKIGHARLERDFQRAGENASRQLAGKVSAALKPFQKTSPMKWMKDTAYLNHPDKNTSAADTATGTLLAGIKKSALVIGGFLYSLLAPLLLLLAGIVLVVTLAAIVASSLITVGAISQAAEGAQETFLCAMPYYNQGDYGTVPFNGNTVKSDGCGICSFAMVAAALTGKQITPADVASVANTDGQYNTVNTHNAIKHLSTRYGLEEPEEMGGPSMNCCGKKTFNRGYVIQKVSSFHPVILSMTGGYYNPSGGGHYIVIYGAGNNGAVVFDPGNQGNYESAISGGGHNWDQIFQNAKHLWIYPQVKITLAGATNAEKLFQALKSYGGLSDAAAAGIVGNVYQETNHGGEDIKLDATDGYGGGIVGWTDYTYSDGRTITNFTKFKEYAAAKGDPWPGTGLETQAEYLIYQLEHGVWYWSGTYSSPYGEGCNISYEAFKNLQDPALAAKVFCAKFEQPPYEYSNIDYRVQMAQKVYVSFADK